MGQARLTHPRATERKPKSKPVKVPTTPRLKILPSIGTAEYLGYDCCAYGTGPTTAVAAFVVKVDYVCMGHSFTHNTTSI